MTLMARFFGYLALTLVLSATAACAEVRKDDEASIEREIRAFLQRDYATYPTEFRPSLKFAFKSVDLNDDKRPEVIVYLTGRLICGSGGCTTSVFSYDGGKLREMVAFNLASEPILVSRKSSHGWKNIIATDRNGAPLTIEFNGSRYQDDPNDAPMASRKERDAAVPAIYKGSRRYSVY